ncbi:MAG: hypothetical protein DWI00_09480 [Planctomycetota bacterium]|nr:MAG: hypothetical protein DWI00_09480 [Planctomycetota bacterium]
MAETNQSEVAKRNLLFALCDGRLGRQVFMNTSSYSACKRVVQNNCDDDQQAPERARILSA